MQSDGYKFVLTAPLTEIIDNPGFAIQMGMASMPGWLERVFDRKYPHWKHVPLNADGSCASAPAGLRVLEEVLVREFGVHADPLRQSGSRISRTSRTAMPSQPRSSRNHRDTEAQRRAFKRFFSRASVPLCLCGYSFLPSNAASPRSCAVSPRAPISAAMREPKS